MAKPKPPSKPPSRRHERQPVARPSRQPLATTELSAKLQQIAEFIDRLPPVLAAGLSGRGGEVAPGGPESTGVEVADWNLLTRSDRLTTAQVVTLGAYPHPERHDCLVIRLDGWDGHLLLTLSRDRAALLADRLRQAIETSHTWYDPPS